MHKSAVGVDPEEIDPIVSPRDGGGPVDVCMVPPERKVTPRRRQRAAELVGDAFVESASGRG